MIANCIFGNFWIAIIAVMACFFTEKALGLNLPDAFLPFVGFATLASYNFHAYLNTFYIESKSSRRLLWIKNNAYFLLISGILAAIVSFFFFFLLTKHALFILPIAFATFLYSAPQIPLAPFIYLRKIAIGKTLYLSFSWTYVTVILPCFIAEMPFSSPQNIYFLLNRFLLIYIIAILFDRKDKENDQYLSVKNLIMFFTDAQIKKIIYLCICILLLTTLLFYSETKNIRHLFALLSPIFLLLISLPFVAKTDNDYVYYGYLDALLLVSGLFFLG